MLNKSFCLTENKVLAITIRYRLNSKVAESYEVREYTSKQATEEIRGTYRLNISCRRNISKKSRTKKRNACDFRRLIYQSISLNLYVFMVYAFSNDIGTFNWSNQINTAKSFKKRTTALL